jgi:hypothetical protein
MRTPLRVLAVASFLAFSASSFAAPQTPKKELTPQQQRMGACNTQATGKKGDERKAFMSSCLKGDTPAKATPQQKMKTCNADASAKTLKGDERKKYMSACLHN